MIVLLASFAVAAPSVGFATGFDARLGKGAVYVGVGGGPTVRIGLGEHLDAHAEARLLLLAGTVGVVRAGVGLGTTVQTWQPGVGLDLGLFVGPSLRAVTAENPDLAPALAPVVQVRLDPLRFAAGRFTAEALRVQVGSGWDRGRPALAIGVTVAEVGIAW